MINFITTKKYWKFCKAIYKIGIWFWILETVFFLFKDGWHVKPISQLELICDKIVDFSFLLSAILLVLVVTDIVEYLLSNTPNHLDKDRGWVQNTSNAS